MNLEFLPKGSVEIPDIEVLKGIQLKAEKTAVVVVDMQNDFVRNNGALYVEQAAETLPGIKKLLETARSSNAKVVYTQDTHYQNDKEWEIWPKHCEKGSSGWKIVDELEPKNNEMVFQKNRYDGFYGTSLQHYLGQVWKIENVIIVGTVANICVLQTAASAGLRWYNVIIPANGISANNNFDQAVVLRQTSFLYNGKIIANINNIDFN